MTCKRCGEEPRLPSRTICRPCHLAERRVREYESNKRLNQANRERYATDVRYRLIIQARNTLHFYNLTPCSFTRMRIEQNDLCAVCNQPRPDERNWHVDHDHACCSTPARSCGKCVRALLCTRCNTGLGMFGDDPARMRAAADYIERHRDG